MRFSRGTAIAILAFATAGVRADCDCEGATTLTHTITETSTVSSDNTITLTNAVVETQISAVTITETNDVTAFATVTQVGSAGGSQVGESGATSAAAVVTGGTGNSGISSGDNGEVDGGGEGSGGNGGGGESGVVNPVANPFPPYTAEINGRSTSCDYDAAGKSTVFEYPAAAATHGGNYTCNNAVYFGTEVIINVILMLEVTELKKDETLTVFRTVTKSSNAKPAKTPAQPPPPTKPKLISPSVGNSTFAPNETSRFNLTISTNQTGPQPPLSTSNAVGRVHPIGVSIDGQFMYASNFLNATIGEFLQFEFQGTNITVYESSLESPCSPIPGGFQTGFNSTSSNVTLHIDSKTKIEDHHARTFFCGGQCTQETVFAVNVQIEEWETLQASLPIGRRLGTSQPRREPMAIPKREPQIPGRRSLNWWNKKDK